LTALDVSEKEDNSMGKSPLNPEGLAVPRGSYSLVAIAQPGRMVFIAGQTASDPRCSLLIPSPTKSSCPGKPKWT